MSSVVCLKRRKTGEIVQGCDVYIGRRCAMGGWNLAESIWHNPYSIKQCGSVEECVRKFETYMRDRPGLLARLPELRGKVLGCWCKKKGHELCHGDVLIKLLNEVHSSA
jgi:hypothetical protein